tara:strand:- start:99 stop:686 length:588 start_codon:yes stop_codon:yes gene_type:complete
MAYKDSILVFKDDRIETASYSNDYIFDYETYYVMDEGERPIMVNSSEYICESKGDILEIGFGMGMCSDYIQAQGVNSHTIVEIHPQIIEKMKIWAEDKSNVTLVEGDWYEVRESLGKYDGIFIDTSLEDHNWKHFKDFAISKANSGAKVTYYHNHNKPTNLFGFDNITHKEVPISPHSNSYTEFNDIYYMPKVII